MPRTPAKPKSPKGLETKSFQDVDHRGHPETGGRREWEDSVSVVHILRTARLSTGSALVPACARCETGGPAGGKDPSRNYRTDLAADPSRLASLLVVVIRRVLLLLAPRQPGASTAQIHTSIFSRVLIPARVPKRRFRMPRGRGLTTWVRAKSTWRSRSERAERGGGPTSFARPGGEASFPSFRTKCETHVKWAQGNA